MRILGIAGSLRQGSHNRALLAAAAEVLPEGAAIDFADLRELPLYDADVEREGVPEVVRAFTDWIRAADGLLIATPEYNESISGVLHNAIDWASRPSPPTDASPLREKPVAIMGAAGGRSGTASAQGHLRQILGHLHADLVAQPQVRVGRARTAFDSEGRLTDDEVRGQLRDLIAALAVKVKNRACEQAVTA